MFNIKNSNQLKNAMIITNDVETTSILNNCLSDRTGEKVLNEGMPLLLELYSKFKIKTTFFFTGHIAEKYPEIVKMVLPYGHEIGSHGYSHEVNKTFDLLSLDEQIEQLKKSKTILEDISLREVISFRAPAARVNKHTANALAETGFKIDSSVSSQRFDMFMSFGSIKKLNWLKAPRTPYFTKDNNLWERGNGRILEIPISALVMPYIGTSMRISPFLTRQLRKTLAFESSLTNKPIVFLVHPNEFIEEKEYPEEKKSIRRSRNYLGYLLGDVIRRRLKLRNLGRKAIPFYEQEIRYFLEKEFTFLTCKEYYNITQKENRG